MIKVEYVFLPVTSLTQIIYFKMSGDVNTGWLETKLSAALAMPRRGEVESMEETLAKLFRGEAALMHANMHNKSAGELTAFNDTEIELVHLEPNSSHNRQYGAPFAMGQQTDTLTFEYVHLPILHNKYHYLYRFISPLPTVWQLETVETIFREVETLFQEGEVAANDSRIRQFNAHKSLDQTLKEGHALHLFKNYITGGFMDAQNLPRGLFWMTEIEKTDVIECKLEEVNGKVETGPIEQAANQG